MVERRSFWLLCLLLLAQLILLAGQAANPQAGGSRLETILLGLVAPLARGVDGTVSAVTGLSDALTLNSTLKRQKGELEERVESLEAELLARQDLEGEVRELSRAVDYARAAEMPLLVSRILYMDNASWLQTLILRLDQGGVEINQPVAAADGLVGRVVVRVGPYVKVQLITDRAASVGAMIRRTRRQGLVRGVGVGELALDFVPLQEDVELGDEVVTAGIDGIYPQGIQIGTVAEVRSDGELFHRIRVAPSVDFGTLETVYVLGRAPLPEKVKEVTPVESP